VPPSLQPKFEFNALRSKQIPHPDIDGGMLLNPHDRWVIDVGLAILAPTERFLVKLIIAPVKQIVCG